MTVKLCVDCRHYELPPGGGSYSASCLRPYDHGTSLVTGNPLPPFQASRQREEDHSEMWARAGVDEAPTCGPEAKYFESYS